jgi:hypothetical protein
MAYTPAVLIENTQIAATATPYYVGPSLTNTQITQCTIMNTDTNAHLVTFWLTSDQQTPNPPAMIARINLSPSQSYVVYQLENLIVPAGGAIQAECDTQGVVSVNASGIQITS